MENKSLQETIEVKREGEHLYVEGYAAVYGNIDSYKDIIQMGAFDAFLASEDVKRVRFCAEHDIRNVIGVVEELRSDEKGLFFKARLSNTTLGRDYATLLEDGAVKEFSIGYKTEDSIYKDDGVRVLTKLYLYEFSVVSRAANDKAVLTGTERKKEAVKDTPLNEMTYEQLREQADAAKARYAEVQSEMDSRIINAINL